MELGSRYEFHILPVESELTKGQKLPISGSVLCNVVAQPSEKKNTFVNFILPGFGAPQKRGWGFPDRNQVNRF